jgi:KAP family P-loop domain
MVAEPTHPAADKPDRIVPNGQDIPSGPREDQEAPGAVGLAEDKARQPVEVVPPTEAKASAPPPTVTGPSAPPREPEREAGEPGSGSGLGRPSLTMLADAPLANDAQDRLGFPAYADALAGLLDHPDTDTPLTIAISAPWGAGKTSLANMVIQRLVDRPVQRGDRPHIVCWFNAWLHDDAPHLGAAFAAEVAKTANQHRTWPRRLLWPLPSALLSPEERWRRRILLALGTLTVAIVVALMPGMQAAVKTNASTVESVRAVAGQRWASLALLALVALAIWRKLFAAAQATARFVDDPKSEAATGSMRQVREQLGRLIQQATRNPGRVGAWLKQTVPWVARFAPRYRTERRRLVLVVDDLERCRPPRAVEVCEVASQLLGHPDVVTILVADMSTVATSAEIKYAALESVAGDGKPDGQFATVAKGAYGRLYLQKLVQIQFDLPPAALATLRGMLTKAPEAPPPEQARLLSRRAIRILVRSMRILAVAGRVSGSVEKLDGRRFPIEDQLEKGDPRPCLRDYRLSTVSAPRSRSCSPPSSPLPRSSSRSPA